MALERRWLLCRVLLAVWALTGLTAAAENGPSRVERSPLSRDTPMATFSLSSTVGELEDLKIELFGTGTLSVLSISVALYDGSRLISKKTLSAPSTGSETELWWLLCGSQGTNKVEVIVEWKDDRTTQNIVCEITKKDLRLGNEEWEAKSVLVEYRRLSWPTAGGETEAAAVVIRSDDAMPAVACLSYQCIHEGDMESLVSPDYRRCHEFTTYKMFKFGKDVTRPSYLYVRPLKPRKVIGKMVRGNSKAGTAAEISDWLARPENRPPTEVTPKAAASGSGSRRREQPGGARMGSESPSSGRPQSQSVAAAPAPAPAPARAQYSARRVVQGPAGAVRGRPLGSPAGQATVTDSRSVSVHNKDTNQRDNQLNHGDNQVNNQYNCNVHPLPYAAKVAPPVTAESPRPPAAQPTMLEQEVRGTVSAREPLALVFGVTPQQVEGGVLLFEMDANDTMEVFLHLTSEYKILRVSSVSGGGGRSQLCPRQLPGRLLRATVTTASESAVAFTARLRQPDSQLSVRLWASDSVTPCCTSISRTVTTCLWRTRSRAAARRSCGTSGRHRSGAVCRRPPPRRPARCAPCSASPATRTPTPGCVCCCRCSPH